jgi:hypothetical protein
MSVTSSSFTSFASILFPALLVVGCAADVRPGEEDMPAIAPGTVARQSVGVDECATQAPDASVFFGDNEASVAATSPDASYRTRSGCHLYITDAYVFPSAATPPAGYSSTISFTSSGGTGPAVSVLTQADCPTYHDYSALYVQHYGESSFTRIGTIFNDGVWIGNRCTLHTTGAYVTVAAPASGWDIYRIAGSHQVLGAYATVRDAAFHWPS